ncbi:MAG: sulfatase-like hydrolase/transferase [Bacteroidota bacterium]
MKNLSRIWAFTVLAILFGPGSCTQPANEELPDFRNVVLLIGDDHSTRVLGCYGNEQIHTPNLDRMAAGGSRFARAFANAPLCSASRQSLLTGRYPHAAGVTLLRTSFPEEQYTLAEHLLGQGFRTGVIGKTHFNNGGSHGFETVVGRQDWQEQLEKHPPKVVPDSIAVRPQWKPFRDPARIWLNAETLPGGYYDADITGTFYAEQAQSFIQEHQDERFLLWVGFHEPHSPFNFPVEDQGRYQAEEMKLPPTSPEDDRWIPAVFKDLNEEEQQGIVAAYYHSVEHLDKNVGLILNQIESLGLTEETLVIYLGDHGYLLGDHKRFEKHMMWEPAVNAPLIIQAGGRYGKGQVVNGLTEFVDVVPTVLEALGVPAMERTQGSSLIPVLEKPRSPHKTAIFSEFLADHKAMIRTDRWKYVYTTGDRDLGQGYATGLAPPGVTHRLYDVVADPYEMQDLSSLPAHQDTLQSLKGELLQWFEQTHPNASEVPQGLSLEEQLAWFCIPPEGEQPDAK